MIEKQPKLNDFAKHIYEGNKERGFDVKNENIGQTLMLVVSELSEALEADRKDKKANVDKFLSQMRNCPVTPFGKDYPFTNSFEYNIKDTFEDEIADTFIRLMDLCGGLGIDIDFHIEQKLAYNATREFKHGKKY